MIRRSPSYARASSPDARITARVGRGGRNARPSPKNVGFFTRQPATTVAPIGTATGPTIREPITIWGSDLRVWWRPDAAAITVASENLSTWLDQSGNGFNVVTAGSGAQPTFDEAGGPGGTPAVVFNTNQHMASDLTGSFIAGDKLSWFVVCAFGDYTRNGPIMSWRSSSFANAFSIVGGPPNMRFVQSMLGAGTVVCFLPITDNSFHSIEVIAQSTGNPLCFSGGVAGTVVPGGGFEVCEPIVDPIQTGFLASGSAGGSFSPVSICEVCMVRGVPTAGQIADWRAYSLNRYGVLS